MDPNPTPATIALDPVALIAHASAPVQGTVAILIAASTLVWTVAVVKLVQLFRLRRQQLAVAASTADAMCLDDLRLAAREHRGAPGGRVIAALLRIPTARLDRLRAVADREIVAERRRAGWLASPLGTVAAASPFVGLFGTVYGIMDAFVRIGAEKSASLPVVAPAIGEALVTTAIGLATAIPAVVFYNAIEKRAADLCAELEAAAAEWVAVVWEARPASYVDAAPASGRERVAAKHAASVE